MRESRRALRARAHEMDQRLGEIHPEARCELDFVIPFQLLVATVPVSYTHLTLPTNREV